MQTSQNDALRLTFGAQDHRRLSQFRSEIFAKERTRVKLLEDADRLCNQLLETLARIDQATEDFDETCGGIDILFRQAGIAFGEVVSTPQSTGSMYFSLISPIRHWLKSERRTVHVQMRARIDPWIKVLLGEDD